VPNLEPEPLAVPAAGNEPLATWLQRHGRYYLPKREYCHHLLVDFFVAMGFRVLSVERFDWHPIWRVRAKLTDEAQMFLLLNVPDSHPLAPHLLNRHLRVAIGRFLRKQGERVLAKDVVVVRAGVRVQAAFEWRRGYPGIWKPRVGSVDPWRVSLVLRRWLQAQAD